MPSQSSEESNQSILNGSPRTRPRRSARLADCSSERSGSKSDSISTGGAKKSTVLEAVESSDRSTQTKRRGRKKMTPMDVDGRSNEDRTNPGQDKEDMDKKNVEGKNNTEAGAEKPNTKNAEEQEEQDKVKMPNDKPDGDTGGERQNVDNREQSIVPYSMGTRKEPRKEPFADVIDKFKYPIR